MARNEVFIIGTGIVGVLCGLNLARRGKVVNFIDHRQPGTAASYGNAGSIASWGMLPDAAPEVFRKALRWMLQKDGFVKIQPRYLPQMIEWLYHYYKAGRHAQLHESAKALSHLVAYSQKTLWPIVEDTHVSTLIEKTGGLSIYDREVDLQREVASLENYKSVHGFAFNSEILSHDELREIEPDLPRAAKYGLFNPDDASIREPGEIVKRWFQLALANGGNFHQDKVIGFDTGGGKISRILLESGAHKIVGDCPIVVAAGAWSHRLAGKLGHRVPLRASRGYHLSFPQCELSFRRTVLFEDHGFMVNHMSSGLRFAGTVEYDDPDAPQNEKRVENLRKRVFRCFPSLSQKPHSTWVGPRPSLPDSLPVISASERTGNVFFAFGHGSLGITNASATGAIIADLVTEQSPEISIEPYRIDRFRLL